MHWRIALHGLIKPSSTAEAFSLLRSVEISHIPRREHKQQKKEDDYYIMDCNSRWVLR